jgi:hypothetical protein
MTTPPKHHFSVINPDYENAIGSPLRVEILMHHYLQRCDYPRSPASVGEQQKLIDMGALTINTDTCLIDLTPIGRAWVECILQTKIPIMTHQIIDGNGRVIMESTEETDHQ